MADDLLPGRGAGAPHDWTDAELERALRAVGRGLAFPATPDLARSVRTRLAARPATPPPAGVGWRAAVAAWFAGLSPIRAVAAAVLAILVLGAAVLSLSTDARDTVAGWFGVRGIRIVFVDETPTPVPTLTVQPTPAASPTAAPLGSNLLLGEPVSLDDAQARVDFPLRLPDSALLGSPDEVYLRQRSDGAMVSFVYYPRPPGLPAAAETGVGLLFVQFEAPEDAFFLEKSITPANDPEIVQVRGDDALWLGGAHYLMIAPDPALGSEGGPEVRTAGNVLLWDEDGVTFRLESRLSSLRAIELAESLMTMATPVPGVDRDAPATPTP